MTCSFLPAAVTWLYSNKPHYPSLFVVCPHALRWSTIRGTGCASSALFSMKIWIKRISGIRYKIKHKRAELHAEGGFMEPEKAPASSEDGFLCSDGEEVEGAGMLGCCSSAAYVQRAIKVKDLQFSPGPQQPRTLLGITENDLQGGWTVSLPKLQRLLGNPNHIIPH